MDLLLTSDFWISLSTLTLLEIVLGIDNIIFLSIVVDKLPKEYQKSARLWGLGLAFVLRVILLLSISWIMAWKEPLFGLLGFEISGNDLVMIFGGLFLIAKSTSEIHHRIEGDPEEMVTNVASGSFFWAIVQIALIDLVFSFDSVITAIGLAKHIPVMIIAVMIAIGIMMIFSGPISNFVNENPTIKILALSFLILVGFTLVVEGLGVHIPKGYIYFAMAFAVLVEYINHQIRRRMGGGVS